MKWIKANEQLPDILDAHEKIYRLDGKKSNGILVESEGGGLCFEYRDYIRGWMVIHDLSRIEWLDDSPSGVNASPSTFITNGIDGWQAGFTIGVQTFYLQPVGCEVGDERDTEERAKWYQGCLEAAFENIVSKPPSSGANVLVNALKNIMKAMPDTDEYDPGQLIHNIIGIAGKAIAEYNAATPQTPIDRGPEAEEQLWQEVIEVYADWDLQRPGLGFKKLRELLSEKYHITRK